MLHPSVIRRKIASYKKKIDEATKKINDYQQFYCGHEDLNFVATWRPWGINKVGYEHNCNDCGLRIFLPKKQARI